MGFFDRYQKVLDTCLSSNVFGEPAQYLARNAAPETVPTLIQGVPSREAIEIILGDMTPSRGRKATFGVSLKRLKDKAVEPKEGDSLRWREIDFKIKTVIPDGEGGAVLVLQKANAS